MRLVAMVMLFAVAAAQAAAQDMVGKIGELGDVEVRLQDKPCPPSVIALHGVPASETNRVKGGTVEGPIMPKMALCWLEYDEDHYFVIDAAGGFGTIPKALFGAKGV